MINGKPSLPSFYSVPLGGSVSCIEGGWRTEDACDGPPYAV